MSEKSRSTGIKPKGFGTDTTDAPHTSTESECIIENKNSVRDARTAGCIQQILTDPGILSSIELVAGMVITER